MNSQQASKTEPNAIYSQLNSMNRVADRINTISESQTIAMAKKGRELSAKGHDVINLSFGEPDFQTPQHIKEAAKKAIDDGYTFYTPVAGYPELRKAISEKFKKENELEYTPEQIVVSTGAKHSIMNAVLALVNPGDEVIVPTPFWVSYSEMIKFAEGVPVYINTGIENNFKPTSLQIKQAITPKTKLVMFSSPCNPSGSHFNKEELREIAEVIASHPDIYIISDEIYEHINFAGKHESIAQFDFIKDRVVTVNGVSKAFAMTGWRIGYMAAPKWIADACEKLQSQFTSGTCSIAQRAAMAALTSELTPTMEMKEAFLRRRNLVLSLLNEIPLLKTNVPDGAFYIFPDVKEYYGKSDGATTIKNGEDLCIYLLENAFVALVPGEAFGNPDCIRISYATSDERLTDAMNRIKNCLNKLK